MHFERIDKLVTHEGYSLQCWDDRYSKGVWAALGSWENQVDTVRNLSSDGDLDMIPAMDYVFSADWLPYVTGRTLTDALQKLEERLASLPQTQLNRNGQWIKLVSDAIEALADNTLERSWYGKNPPDSLADLPRTFDLAVSQRAMVTGT
jgi:hypothetical protein